MTLTSNKFPPQLWTPEARRVAIATGVGSVLALVYVLLVPNWYQSSLTVIPATPSKSGFGAQVAGLFGPVDIPELGLNADVERIAAVLESTSVSDAVIKKFGLMERYGDRYIEHTRRNLWSHCSTRIDRRARVVSLTCEDKDPRFVQAMLDYFGTYGNEVFRRVTASSATEEVRFLERRVFEMRAEADDAALRLRRFEERFKIVDLETQSKAVVGAMASLRSQEISKELQLSYMSTFSSRDEATAIQLRQQLAVMNSKFRKLEEPQSEGDPTPSKSSETREVGAKSADMFPPAMTVPKLRFELEQLFRDRKIREGNLVLLMQRLEMAKVNEARDTSAFQILDAPALPTYKSRPKRSLVVLVGMVLGVVTGVVWSRGRERIASLLREMRLAQSIIPSTCTDANAGPRTSAAEPANTSHG